MQILPANGIFAIFSHSLKNLSILFYTCNKFKKVFQTSFPINVVGSVKLGVVSSKFHTKLSVYVYVSCIANCGMITTTVTGKRMVPREDASVNTCDTVVKTIYVIR